jgi:hypothetical protein
MSKNLVDQTRMECFGALIAVKAMFYDDTDEAVIRDKYVADEVANFKKFFEQNDMDKFIMNMMGRFSFVKFIVAQKNPKRIKNPILDAKTKMLNYWTVLLADRGIAWDNPNAKTIFFNDMELAVGQLYDHNKQQ